MDGEEGKDRGTLLAEERTVLAVQRTAIAAERTLMAWIRTALSMISFGFSIYKFVQYLHEQSHGVRVATARNLGLTLIALGTLALLAAIIEYRQFIASLGEKTHLSPWTTAFIVAILMALVGVLAFIGVLTRAGPY